jgi:hypothetical protein
MTTSLFFPLRIAENEIRDKEGALSAKARADTVLPLAGGKAARGDAHDGL